MTRLSAGLFLVLLLFRPVSAAVVTELENSGTMNNVIADAEVIGSASFTTPVPFPATVFDPPGWPTVTIEGTGGGDDVDFYAFSTLGGGALFDIDNTPFTFDTVLSLFDSTGTLIAFGDDSDPPDPGSELALDSFLGEITLAPGTYYIAVSGYPNFPSVIDDPGVSFSDLLRPDNASEGAIGGVTVDGATPGDSSFMASGPGDALPYTLHISLEQIGGEVVPEPGTLAIWSVLGAALVVGMRRRL